MQITPEQIRAARALLRMEQEELARRVKMSVVTVRRFEAEGAASRTSNSTRAEVQRALEQAGAEFIEGERPVPHDTETRFEAWRAISLRSAERLRGRQQAPRPICTTSRSEPGRLRVLCPWRARDLPLLFKGEDFLRTDMVAAV